MTTDPLTTAPRSFFEFLGVPVTMRTRIALALVTIPLLLSFLFPLWRVRLVAPQYPAGLHIDIYSYKLDAGRGGADLQEINILNHYIGMQQITRENLRDLDWIPVALGALALLVLRCAVLGNVRVLLDTMVLATYFGVVALARFVYVMYTFGSHLDPKAPMDVEPFMPAVLGTKKIANFTTSSYPVLGTFMIGAFLVCLWGTAALELWRGRRAAHQAEAALSS